MKNWLDRCESVCCPDTDLLCADKVKLRNELLNVQVNDLVVCFSDRSISMSILLFHSVFITFNRSSPDKQCLC